MWLITREGWAKANMLVAVGSFITRTRENAFRVGVVIHAISAFLFAMVYAWVMIKFGMTHLPNSIFAGTGIGIVHGLVVSLMLVWVVSDEHPLAEFQEAGFAVGLSHFAGHVVYGAFVGLAVGLSPL